MKCKSILLLLCVGLFFSFSTESNFKKTHNDNALILSNDKDFIEMFNSIINFSYSVAKEKKANFFQDYASGTASEENTTRLLEIGGFRSKEELKQFFLDINEKQKLINNKFDFLNNKETQNDVIKRALEIAAKNGKFIKLMKLPEDCLIALMADLAICYAAYDFCWANSGIDCVALWSACIALAWNAYDSCFY